MREDFVNSTYVCTHTIVLASAINVREFLPLIASTARLREARWLKCSSPSACCGAWVAGAMRSAAGGIRAAGHAHRPAAADRARDTFLAVIDLGEATAR